MKSSLENPISTQTMRISACVSVSDIKLYGADYQQGQKLLRTSQDSIFFFQWEGVKTIPLNLILKSLKYKLKTLKFLSWIQIPVKLKDVKRKEITKKKGDHKTILRNS